MTGSGPVVGGIIPPEDAHELTAVRVARVHKPKNCKIQDIMANLVGIVTTDGQKAA